MNAGELRAALSELAVVLSEAGAKETFNDNRYGFCGRGLTV